MDLLICVDLADFEKADISATENKSIVQCHAESFDTQLATSHLLFPVILVYKAEINSCRQNCADNCFVDNSEFHPVS
jgi:hypothetical protein